MNRLRIYAALSVPEVWRLDGDELRMYQLAGKKYVEIPSSATWRSRRWTSRPTPPRGR